MSVLHTNVCPGSIKQSQKRKYFAAAAAGMIWLHSIRAMEHPELRIYGRQMWVQLERGFLYIEEGAESIKLTTGDDLDISNGNQFPVGLEPMAQ